MIETGPCTVSPEFLGEELIFVIALPRSGSTLLQHVLGAHSLIHTLPEPWVMLHALYALRGQGITAEYDANLARDALHDFLDHIGGEETYYAAVRAWAGVLYRRALADSGRRFFVDKTPRYFHVIQELARAFPRARFVLLLRHPLAVLSSVLRTWFNDDTRAFVSSTHYTDLTRGPRLLCDGIKRLGERAVVVRYESLVSEPERCVRDMCERLGISFEPRMLNYGCAGVIRGRFGDQQAIARHDVPVTDYRDAYLSRLATPGLAEFAARYQSELGDELLALMGYAREQIGSPLPAGSGASLIGPGSARQINADGERLFLAGDLAGARACFERAYSAAPGDAEACNNLAAACWQLGDERRALAVLAEGLELAPDHRALLMNAVAMLSAYGRAGDVLPMCRAYAARHPADAEFQQLLAGLERSVRSADASRSSGAPGA
jgi:tetratricopeptide (TPR) repeat protein